MEAPKLVQRENVKIRKVATAVVMTAVKMGFVMRIFNFRRCKHALS